jgi:hypothetical protein
MGFVHGRFILDNVFLAFEAMEWANESDENLIMLLLNFEKAYDIINWTLLQESMRELGFSNQWIQWTTTLYEEAKTSMVVNGQKGKYFKWREQFVKDAP